MQLKNKEVFTNFKNRSKIKINWWFIFERVFNCRSKDELEKIKKIKQEIDRDYLIYKTGIMKKSKTYDFQKFKIIWSFGREIYSVITRKYAFEEKLNLIN